MVALADYGVYIATPTVKAITKEYATDAENLHIIDGLTAWPQQHTCGCKSRKGTKHPIKE